jgi:hypothetical protein
MKKIAKLSNHIIEKKKKPIDYSESINNFEYPNWSVSRCLVQLQSTHDQTTNQHVHMASKHDV